LFPFKYHIIIISLLAHWQIKLANRFIGDMGCACKLSVDGTDFRIPQPTQFWKGWFSFKFKGPGLRYEVALGIQPGYICWVNGPFAPGCWVDISIFRAKLKQLLRPGEKVEADAGYRGDGCTSPPDDCANMRENLMKQEARSRHETVNRRLKQFNCMHQFRHNIDDHVYFFEAVAVVTQLGIESGERLYNVLYDRL